jgi:hypothetical protein
MQFRKNAYDRISILKKYLQNRAYEKSIPNSDSNHTIERLDDVSSRANRRLAR